MSSKKYGIKFKETVLEYLQSFQDIFAFIPLLLVLSFVFAIAIQTIELGHLPVFDQDPPPSDLVPTLYLITLALLAFAQLTIYAWVFLAVMGFLLFWKSYRINKVTLGIFLLGLLLFFSLFFFFPRQMEGFFD